ncbi:hypothetical protein vseg_010825 [Gypsophila vaccaria]
MTSSDGTTACSTNEVTKTPQITNSTTNVNNFIPLCPEEKKPKIGQVFQTLELGEQFYKEYGSVCGFTTKLATTRRPSGRSSNNIIMLRNMVCNRESIQCEKKKTEV